MAGFIRVVRKGVSGGYLRWVEVHIDRSKVGTISHGSEGVFPVVPGDHVINVCIDVFFGSPDVDVHVAEGKTVSYTCRERGFFEGGFIWFVRPKAYLILEPSG